MLSAHHSHAAAQQLQQGGQRAPAMRVKTAFGGLPARRGQQAVTLTHHHQHDVAHCSTSGSSSGLASANGLISRRHAHQPHAHPAPATSQSSTSRVSIVPSASASAAAGGGSLGGALGMLRPENTRPVDRLRYQALMVFKHLDTDGDGVLSPEQLRAYCTEYCGSRLGASNAALGPSAYDPALSAAAAKGGCDTEAFVDLVRAQVKAMKGQKGFPMSVLPQAQLGRIAFSTGLPPAEISGLLALFRLLDTDNDAKLSVAELRATCLGLEAEMFEEVLEDADSDDDGYLTFQDWLGSYAQEKPVLLNAIVLAAHCGVYWCILNLLPFDITTRALLCCLLLFKPQVITGTVIKVYHMFKSVYDRIRAEIAVADARMGPKR